jgi:hypothetical protein
VLPAGESQSFLAPKRSLAAMIEVVSPTLTEWLAEWARPAKLRLYTRHLGRLFNIVKWDASHLLVVKLLRCPSTAVCPSLFDIHRLMMASSASDNVTYECRGRPGGICESKTKQTNQVTI